MKPNLKPKSKVEQPFDYLQKIIIIGDSGVGKSNLLLRYTEGKFVDNYMMTIGINYVYKVVDIEGVKIKLQIWDTAGQDKYKTITQNYYRNSQGVLIVFGINSRDSFNSIQNWIDDLAHTGADTAQIMFVGNKMDLEEQREVSFNEAEELAKKHKLQYIQCSAKSGESVKDVFQTLARTMKERFIDQSVKEPSKNKINLNGPEAKNKCCFN